MENSLIILGATATGKTRLAVEMARKMNGEIISADSRQVYKGLDIGSGKDLNEYQDIKYHLIDIRELKDEYNVFAFQQDVYSVFQKIISRSSFPIIAGGTPLYIDAIVNSYPLLPVPINSDFRHSIEKTSLEELQAMLLKLKPDIHNKTDLENRERLIRAIEIAMYKKENFHLFEKLKEERPLIKPRIIGINFEKEELEQRIYKRLISRIKDGMIEEVEALHYEKGIEWDYLESLGLEYRFTSMYLQGKIATKEEYIVTTFRHICKFAKRQKTWFRKMERQGIKIEWING
ncbi:MAG: tRNA (adenosine(37)-N6)-dimethylallyltransferase MiaA [Treponema sp.]